MFGNAFRYITVLVALTKSKDFTIQEAFDQNQSEVSVDLRDHMTIEEPILPNLDFI